MQEVEAHVQIVLERPSCMNEPQQFVQPEKQCPSKPKGRKPKTPAAESKQPVPGRPSAAACGFSTHGMTDGEVAQRLDATYGVGAEGSGPEVNEKLSKTARKQTHKARAAGGGEGTGSGAAASSSAGASGAAALADDKSAAGKAPRRKRNKTQAEVNETDAEVPPVPKGQRKPKKTGKRPVRKGRKAKEAETEQIPEEAEPTPLKASPRVRKGKKAKRAKTRTAETGPAEVPPVRKGKRATRAETTEPGPARKKSKRAKATESDEVPTGSAPSKRRRGKSAAPPPPSEPETYVSAVERKSKQSRKSSAYHKARLAAKKAGLSLEEQKAAGKTVS